MCIFHTASWSSALTHHNISQSWFILPKLVQNVLKVGSFSKSWFKMCPKLVHFLKVGSFSKSWYEMCQNQVNNYISNVKLRLLSRSDLHLTFNWPSPDLHLNLNEQLLMKSLELCLSSYKIPSSSPVLISCFHTQNWSQNLDSGLSLNSCGSPTEFVSQPSQSEVLNPNGILRF